MAFKQIWQSKGSRRVLIAIGIIVVALVVFQAGVMVGFHKANFSGRLGDNYYRAFGPRFGFGHDLIPGGHGAVGKVVRVDLPDFVISSPDNSERTVAVTGSTTIRRFRDNVGPEQIAVDDFVTVIGEPNSQGQIQAKLIRLLPPPPNAKN